MRNMSHPELTLPAPLATGLERLLHSVETSQLSTDGAVQELTALLRFLRPTLGETLAAVAKAERRLPLHDASALQQLAWLNALRDLPHLTSPDAGGAHAAERHVNAVRPSLSLSREHGPLAVGLACALLPQWAACLDTNGAHWLQQLRIIVQNLRTVQLQPPREQVREASMQMLRVAALNAQAAVVLHWAACAALAGEVPAFAIAFVDGLVAQLSQLANESAHRADDDALGLAAAVAIGQLVQTLGSRDEALQRALAAKLADVAAACARASAALDDAGGAAGIADATTACLLGLAGAAWRALLRSREADEECLALVDALVPLATPSRGGDRDDDGASFDLPLELRATAAALLSQFLSQRSGCGGAKDTLLPAVLGASAGAEAEEEADQASLATVVRAIESFRREAARA